MTTPLAWWAVLWALMLPERHRRKLEADRNARWVSTVGLVDALWKSRHKPGVRSLIADVRAGMYREPETDLRLPRNHRLILRLSELGFPDIAEQVFEGELDEDREEAEEYARSEEGRQAIDRLMRGRV